VETRWFAPDGVEDFTAQLCPRVKAVLLESPGSLTMEVHDLPAIIALCRQHGITSILDNTWASPLGLASLPMGVDITLMALTKHVGGHSDLMMGSASPGAEWYDRLRRRAQMLGNVVSPDDAALALRGLRTMGVAKQSTATALTLAAMAGNPPRGGPRALPDAARIARP
jgi:cystathionine beta-lyase